MFGTQCVSCVYTDTHTEGKAAKHDVVMLTTSFRPTAKFLAGKDQKLTKHGLNWQPEPEPKVLPEAALT